MDFFICQGSMRKLVDILFMIEAMHITTYGVSIDKNMDKYKLYVMVSKSDLLKIRDAVAVMEGF